MRIFVQAKPGAKKPGVRQLDETHYAVSVHERAIDGAANEAIARVLAEHLHIAPSRVRLLRGACSKQKIFDVQE